LNCTVPVGVPEPGELVVTVAVNVTDWPKTDGFAEDVIVVVVSAWLTDCGSVPELVVKLPSPLYTAAIVCGLPLTARLEMLPEVAEPPDRATGEPKFTPSITNCIEPDGVPGLGALAVTLAVNVTDWPKTDGFADEETVVVVEAWLTVCVNVPVLVE
jgi:hypothetical protein